MGLLGEAIARLRLDTGNFTSEVRSVNSAWTGLRGNLAQGLAMGIGMAGLATLQSGIMGIGKAMIEGNSRMEQYAVQMEVLYHDADKAKEKIAELVKFAADTPFEIPEVVATGKMLKAFGMDSIEQLKLIGDAASATGRPLQEIAMAMGRLRSGAFGEAFQRFRELGLVTNEMMQKQSGKNMFDNSGQFIGSIKEAMDTVNAILAQNVGGMMERMSQTVEGKVSNIKDAVGSALRAMGENMFNSFSQALSKIMPSMQAFTLYIQGKSREAADVFEATFGKPLSDKIINSLNITKKYVDVFFGSMKTLGKETAEHLDLIVAVLAGFATRFVLLKTLVPIIELGTIAFKGMSVAIVGASGFTGILTAGVTALGAAFRANPIGMILTAIQIAVTTLSLAWASDFGGMRSWVISVIDKVKEFFSVWAAAREKAAEARREMGELEGMGLRRFRTPEQAQQYITDSKARAEAYRAQKEAVARGTNMALTEKYQEKYGENWEIKKPESAGAASTELPDVPRGGSGGGKDKTAYELAEEQLGELKKIQDVKLKDELDYWKQVVAAGTLAGNELLKGEYHILELTRQYMEEQYSYKKAKIDEEAIWTVDLHDAKIELAKKHLADVTTLYGKEGQEYQAAVTEMKRLEKEKYDYYKQIAREYNDFLLNYQTARIDADLKEAEWLKSHGIIKEDQLYKIKVDAEQKKYELNQKRIQDSLNDDQKTLAEKMKLQEELLSLEQQHQLQMDELKRSHLSAKLMEESQYYQQIGGFFVDYVAGMVDGSKSFADFWKGMWSMIVSIAASYAKQLINDWIQNMLLKKLTAQKTQGAIAAGEAAGASAGVSSATAGFQSMMGMMQAMATAISTIMPAGPALAATMQAGIVAAQATMVASQIAAQASIAATGAKGLLGFKYGGEISQDGIIMAHKNETMLPVDEAAYLKKAAKGSALNKDNGTFILEQHNNFIDGADLLARIGQFADEITGMVARVNNNTGVITKA